MRTRILLLCMSICTLLSVNVNAQKKKTARDSTTVIIFNTNSTATYSRKKTGEENVIKIAPLGFISGAFPLAYERRIADFFSIQVDGGLTSQNYIRKAFRKGDGILSGDDSNSSDVGNVFSDGHTAKTGYMYGIQPRFYYEDDALDGTYVGLSYDFYRYNFQTASMTTGGNVDEHENITDFMVHIGHQAVYDRLTIEYSTGIGMRKVKGQQYSYGTDNSGNTVDGIGYYTQNVLNFGFTFKLGYHF